MVSSKEVMKLVDMACMWSRQEGEYDAKGFDDLYLNAEKEAHETRQQIRVCWVTSLVAMFTIGVTAGALLTCAGILLLMP